MIDDKELIRKFTAGDEKAFDQIVQNNLNNVFGFFMKIKGLKMRGAFSQK